MIWNRGFGIVGWLIIVPLAMVVLIILAFAVFAARKAYWDAKVSEMCEKDGGIKIFQTVELSPEEFRRYVDDRGQFSVPNVKFARPDQVYAYSSDSEYIVRGNPEVRKDTYRVLKRPEGMVISESTIYSRVGGDLPTVIGHRTSFSCPRQAETILEKTFKGTQGAGQ